MAPEHREGEQKQERVKKQQEEQLGSLTREKQGNDYLSELPKVGLRSMSRFVVSGHDGCR